MDTNNLDEMAVEEGGDISIEEQEPEEESLEETQGEESEEESEETEDIVSIDGESPPVQEEANQRAPEWVRDVRKKNRTLSDENRRLKAEMEALKAGTVSNNALPEKPTLEAYDYDAEDYEKALEEWHSAKLVHAEREREKARQAEEQNKQWQTVVDSYNNQKTTLKVRDYDIAEEIVTDSLSIEQQAIILQGAENPATVVYALGKNKNKIDELSKIKDPVKFAFAIAKLESKLKVERRSAPPSPEKAVKGAANASGVDSTLERLRKEAEKTGDLSKVLAYKRQKKGN